MLMKKCYVVPSVNVVEYNLSSMVCTSPQTFEENSDGNYSASGVTGAEEMGPGGSFDARERGNDFGSLW